MPRASSVLCLPVTLALAASAHAIDLPVITTGTQVAQAPKTEPDKPAPANVQPPVINNYPSAATQPAANEGRKTDVKPPVIVNEPAAPKPAKAAAAPVGVAYLAPVVSEFMAPVGYNAYGVGGPMLGAYGGGWGYMGSPHMGGTGYFGGYAYDAYTAYAPAMALTPSILDLRPPRVEVLDTGVRANVGRLTSMPAVSSPLWGHAIVVYYR